MRLGALVLCLLAGLLNQAQARILRIWQPDELAQKADLIVIATAHSTADESPRADTFHAKPEMGIPVLTVFDVQSVLKGQLSGKTVAVKHYRYARPHIPPLIVAGPDFVSFNPQRKNTYLIYLKRVNGAYEPLSGQEDPAQSFSLLQPYGTAQESEMLDGVWYGCMPIPMVAYGPLPKSKITFHPDGTALLSDQSAHAECRYELRDGLLTLRFPQETSQECRYVFTRITEGLSLRSLGTNPSTTLTRSPKTEAASSDVNLFGTTGN